MYAAAPAPEDPEAVLARVRAERAGERRWAQQSRRRVAAFDAKAAAGPEPTPGLSRCSSIGSITSLMSAATAAAAPSTGLALLKRRLKQRAGSPTSRPSPPVDEAPSLGPPPDDPCPVVRQSVAEFEALEVECGGPATARVEAGEATVEGAARVAEPEPAKPAARPSAPPSAFAQLRERARRELPEAPAAKAPPRRPPVPVQRCTRPPLAPKPRAPTATVHGPARAVRCGTGLTWQEEELLAAIAACDAELRGLGLPDV